MVLLEGLELVEHSGLLDLLLEGVQLVRLVRRHGSQQRVDHLQTAIGRLSIVGNVA